ncbi:MULTISPECIES: AraC family transcriptional regulator [unclassified Streptomyces]|uniref:AraC family transcriptional regulator n=1 Tax=unclassified Streptomyces TaxID=2593676 RepID=UPI0011CEA75E|nr:MULTISPECIES: AraC family transcriptional regulator [unclassified Streptomyces]TXS79113.1 AraC family transcriptional regulator [Streptomyces sp. me109]
MPFDPLSDTLGLMDARCVVSGGFTAGGDWALRFPRPDRLKITAVVRGSMWVAVEGLPDAVRLERGDVAVFDGSRAIVVASDPAPDPVDATTLFADTAGPMIHHGAGEDVVSVGGHVELGRAGEELLLHALPPLLHVRAAAEEAPVLRWLLDQLLRELTAGRAGADFAADQLAQLMFVQVLRACLADADALPAGRLRAFADERISPALRLMHADPGRPWRLEELARAAAMSRTSFAQRFRSVVGVPPLAYLLDWRMSLARRALRDGETSVSALAQKVGYTSESAFSNAFKRTTGVAPRRYREAARAALTG